MSLHTGLDQLTYNQVFTADQCDWLFEQCSNIEESRWVKRTTMSGLRTLAETECLYYSCLNKAIPKSLYDFLVEHHPQKNENLQEVVINRYLPGNWIPMHRDTHMYRYFTLVPIQSCGDGVEIEGVWFEDNKGLGFDFDGTGHKHRVLEVHQLRFTILYLYE